MRSLYVQDCSRARARIAKKYDRCVPNPKNVAKLKKVVEVLSDLRIRENKEWNNMKFEQLRLSLIDEKK